MNISAAFRYTDNYKIYQCIPSVVYIDNCQSDISDILVTIAIPTYNRIYNTLCDAIDSAINQDYDKKLYEILVVDNNPTESFETQKIISTHYGNVKNFRYYRNSQNLGLFGNWNRCFELAHGKWVVLLHDDDIIFHNFLSILMPIIDKKAPLILKPEMETWNILDSSRIPSFKEKKKKFLRYESVKAYDYIFLGNYIGSPTGCIFDRKKVLDLGGFNLELYPSSDTMFMLFASMLDKVLIYREKLGARRIGTNETFKQGVLDMFIISRYNLLIFLLKKYKIYNSWFQKYVQSHCVLFYEELRRTLKHDFIFDFSQINIDITTTVRRAKIVASVYNNFRRIRILFYNIFN